jgi:glycosyltransferase involved in cell wall biosynthesis
MRILHLLPELNRGGTEQIVVNVTHELNKKGYTTRIVVFSDKNDFVDEIPLKYIIKCRFHIVNRFIRPSIKETQEFEDLLSDFKPDIIHSHSYYTDLLVLETARTGIRYFSHLHLSRDILFLKFANAIKSRKGFTNYIDKTIYIKRIARIGCKLISPSSFVAKEHKKFLPKLLHEKIVTLFNSIDIDRATLKNAEGIFSKKLIRFVSVGRLHISKNQSFLLDLVKAYNDRNDLKVTLDIFGDGDLRNDIQSRIVKLGLKDFVTLKGNTNDLLNELHKYDVYVTASLHETFGLSVLEAICIGLPVVAFHCEGYKDYAINSTNSLLINELDVKSFMVAIDQLIADPKLYKDISRQGKMMGSKFSLLQYVSKLELLYRGEDISCN